MQLGVPKVDSVREPESWRTEELIGAISTRFIAASAVDLSAEIADALRWTGEWAGADMVKLNRLERLTGRMWVDGEWSQSGVPSFRETFDGIDLSAYPVLHRSVTSGSAELMVLSEDLPADATADRELLTLLGFRTIALVPVFADLEVHCFITVESAKEHAEWRTERLRIFGIVARLFESAFIRREADRAMVSYQQLVEATFRSLRDAVFVIEPRTGRILDCNPASTRLFGGTAQELTRLTMSTLVQDVAAEGDPRFHSTGGLYFEGVMLTVRGVPFPAEYCAAPLNMEQLENTLSLFVVHDLTRRKESEIAIRAGEDRLRNAQKMQLVGQLSGGIAHDFNNILSVISGYAELAGMQAAGNQEFARTMVNIKNATGKGARLTRRLLGFSRHHKGDAQPLEVNAFLEDLQKIVYRVVGERVQVTLVLAPEVHKVLVDRFELEQVLLNLCINARDAMPSGGTLTLKTRPRSAFHGNGSKQVDTVGYVEIIVSDIGEGMSPDVASHIFEPFFTTKEEGKGTGLGLYTALNIIRTYGGAIDVESSPGTGSNFSVQLPAIREFEDMKSLSEEEAPPQRLAGEEMVLLVEDDVELRGVTAQLLNSYGYLVHESGDGEDALRAVQSGTVQPDILVTDLVLPHMNGSDLIIALRRRFPSLPVVCISGYASEVPNIEGLDPNAISMFYKPILPEKLLQAIRASLATL